MSDRIYVAWLGDPSDADTSEGPCQNGQCVGTVANTFEMVKGEVTGVTVTWDIQCKLHKWNDSVETIRIRDHQGNPSIRIISRDEAKALILEKLDI